MRCHTEDETGTFPAIHNMVNRKIAVFVFLKDITTWSSQGSNPRPSDPDSDALTTRPQRPQREEGMTLKSSAPGVT